MSKFKVGDVVICVRNPTGKPDIEGSGFKLGHTFTITEVAYDHGNEQEIVYFGGVNNSGVYSDYLRLRKKGEEVMPYQRKTYRLKADSPTMKKGAILQEQCDDGTQPYIMLNNDTHCKDPDFKIKFSKRELIEKQPKFFEEVFAVTPAFLNAKELELWENYKKAQAKKAKK